MQLHVALNAQILLLTRISYLKADNSWLIDDGVCFYFLMFKAISFGHPMNKQSGSFQ